MVVIIDLGMGNLRSVQKALKKIKTQALISDSVSDIEGAQKLVLPGVGSFAEGMRSIQERNLLDVLSEKVIAQKTPILGVCLGMQLFTEHSEEGDVNGLGWVSGKTKRFQFDEGANLKIPHVGWNTTTRIGSHRLLNELPDDSRFYFTHSYYVECAESNYVLAETMYGIRFASIIQKENIMGVQFHPETSHRAGMQLLQNFVED